MTLHLKVHYGPGKWQFDKNVWHTLLRHVVTFETGSENEGNQPKLVTINS